MAQNSGQIIRSEQIRLAKMMFTAGVLIFIIFGYLAFTKIFANPTQVFWGMMDNNLKSYGQTRSIAQDDASRNLSQTQDVQIQLGAHNFARTKTVLTQNANKPQSLSVTTQTLTTPTTNYVRYSNIEVGPETLKGNKPDFSKLQNKWAKQDNPPLGQSTFIEILFGSLGGVPTGYLQPDDRRQLVEYMQKNNVYQIDFNSVHKEFKNGRWVFTYDARVKIKDYVLMLKKFDKMTNLNQLQQIDPERFDPNQAVQLTIGVDVMTRDLKSIDYIGVQQQKDNYSASGAFLPVQIPSKTIDLQNLQQEFQAIISGTLSQ